MIRVCFFKEIAAILSNYYGAVEINYVDSCKIVFRNIRFERSYLIDHFYDMKVNFKVFLNRPDTKQEYVDVFVKVIVSAVFSTERKTIFFCYLIGIQRFTRRCS